MFEFAECLFLRLWDVSSSTWDCGTFISGTVGGVDSMSFVVVKGKKGTRVYF